MWDMNDVKKIKYKKNYIYSIVFDDGTTSEIDFSPYLTNKDRLCESSEPQSYPFGWTSPVCLYILYIRKYLFLNKG